MEIFIELHNSDAMFHQDYSESYDKYDTSNSLEGHIKLNHVMSNKLLKKMLY